jgi:uncharacterized protein with von Willebrand factor type A (vWA) domain
MIDRVRQLFDGFLNALSVAGIETTPMRRLDFLSAVTLVQLFGVDDLYWAGRVTLVSSVDQIPIFDAVFSAWFGASDQAAAEPADTSEEADASRPPERSEGVPPSAPEEGEGTGREASLDELLWRHRTPETDAARRETCRRITLAAERSQPRLQSRRHIRSLHPGSLDIRHTLAGMLRNGGDISRLCYRSRPERMRRTVMLIDVSGSLKATSADALRAAHALARAIPRMEVFTFATRLTRVTRTLAFPDVDDALRGLSEVIFDFDGGTRIGSSFESFLADSRFATLLRGAVVIVVSDGLERGEVGAMTQATDRLSLLAHRLVWLTPLVGDPSYRPVTRGMKAILKSLDRLGDASSLDSFLKETMALDREVERRRRRNVQTA